MRGGGSVATEKWKHSDGVKDKGKPKIVSVHAMEAYWGGRSIVPIILNLHTRSKWVPSLKLQLLYPPCRLGRLHKRRTHRRLDVDGWTELSQTAILLAPEL
jgi:hypothetical protein